MHYFSNSTGTTTDPFAKKNELNNPKMSSMSPRSNVLPACFLQVCHRKCLSISLTRRNYRVPDGILNNFTDGPQHDPGVSEVRSTSMYPYMLLSDSRGLKICSFCFKSNVLKFAVWFSVNYIEWPPDEFESSKVNSTIVGHISGCYGLLGLMVRKPLKFSELSQWS